jgi:hypothetical protein
MRNLKVLSVISSFVILFALGSQKAAAQTSTTGDLTGVVTDPTGAVIPNIKVELKDLQRGGTRETKTTDAGVYRFSLLQDGSYEVDVDTEGFQAAGRTTSVNIGQITTLDLKLALKSTTERVVVVEEAPLIQTESGSQSATLDERTIQTMPNQGNDMSYPLEMTPGVTENTLGGYGNYSVNGMSATSNLFTVDGMDDNDPYLSLNNTGATSLMLGNSEVEEATVVGNGYGGQFGGLAGSNVNFITKGGTNEFHGSATYYWNGRAFNANDFFNNFNGSPRPFVNANQWSGNVGGPVLKNKVFWYFNTEGLRLIVPTSPSPIYVPSTAYENATIANLEAIHPASVPFYNTIFGIYNAAATAHGALPGDGAGGTGCGAFALLGSADCVDNYLSNSAIPTNEKLFAGRVDYNISTNDHVFGRIQIDRGYQGSATDPMNPLFNLVSNQPEDQGQLSENHTFSPTVTNQFIVAGLWYSATFSAPNRAAALAAFPTTLSVTGLSTIAAFDADGPQGRAVTQSQISDDLTKVAGRHTLKFGVKFRRNDVTDMVYGINTSGTMSVPDLTSFYDGGYATLPSGPDPANYLQTFPSSGEQRFKFWTIGGYAEDDIQVKPNFTLTLSLRADHPSNPTCKTDCFSRLSEPFNELITSSLEGADAPYNQIFEPGNRAALTGLTNIEWAPRLGFAWQPLGRNRNTVLRGGFGIFYDAFPGQVVDNISENPPNFQSFTVAGTPTNPLLISPAEPNSLVAAANASNAAFLSGFASGATEAELAANVPGFAPPGINYTQPHTDVPYYEKWSLGIQQGLGKDTSLIVTYAGNHGVHETIQNSTLNAYAPPTSIYAGYVGLPAAPPDAAFGFVNGIFSEGISNYNGVSVSATHRYGSGQITANYTYSHAMDDVSNGGFSPFVYRGFYSTNTAPYYANSPSGISNMYGDSDYDVRHYFSLSYLWELPFKKLTFGHGPDALLKGWTVAGTALARTGLPFSVVDAATSSGLASFNYGQNAPYFLDQPLVPATVVPGVSPGSCSGPGSNAGGPCFNTAAFTNSDTGFGNAGRNTMRGPGYFNSDFSVWKAFKVIPHWEKAEFDLGFQFYNVFNHPNFDNPYYDVSGSYGNFGQIQRLVSPATTVYGVALGADAAPRIVQLKASFKF